MSFIVFIFLLFFVGNFAIIFFGMETAILAIGSLFIFYIIYQIVLLYNKFKREHIKISEARSNIDVYLQQRHEEISAMYKIVQEYKLHELETFKEIVKLRQAASKKSLPFEKKVKIHNLIEERLPKLIALFENYPELRSNQNFLELQKAIENNEANISSARKAYNSYVNQYNTSIAMFPASIFAKIFGFKSESLYETPSSKTANPLLEE